MIVGDKITIGKMAELCGTTIKTLRVYEREGVLVPSETDPQTEYRYYSEGQCRTFAMVKGIQALGYSLEEIRALSSRTGIESLKASLEERKQALKAQISELENAVQVCESMCVACHAIQQHHSERPISIEALPARRIIRLGIHYEGLKDPSLDGMGQINAWTAHANNMRKWIAEQGYPVSVFHNAGGIVGKDQLLSRQIFDTDSFVFAPPADFGGECCPNVPSELLDEMPSGDYVVYYPESIVGADGSNRFIHDVNRLLDYIEEHNLEVAGDYYGIVLAESELFGYAEGDMLYKMCIPVTKKRIGESQRIVAPRGILGRMRQLGKKQGQ